MQNLPSANTANAITGLFGIVSGIGNLFSAKAETKMGSYNAEIDEQRAVAERESFRITELQKRKLIKSAIGTQIAQAGASGFRFTGDPINIMQESLANAEFDIAIDKYNSEVRARGFQSEAAMKRYEAEQNARRYYSSAGSSFLETAANSYLSSLGSGKGTKLGAGTTTYGGVKVPSRYIPPR